MPMQRSIFVALGAIWCGSAVVSEDVDSPLGLGDIDSMLTESLDAVSTFNTQAQKFQEIVNAKHEASREDLASQKEKFEAELVGLDRNNSDMAASSAKISDEIKGFREGNEGLLAEAEKLERGANLMRDALIALEPKMAKARSYVTDSLAKTNLTGQKVLKVLDQPKPEPTLEHFLSVARGALATTKSNAEKKSKTEEPHRNKTNKRLSLLETSGGSVKSPGLKIRATSKQQQQQQDSSPEELVQALSSRISELNSAQEQGTMQMEAHFVALSEEKAKQFQALAAEQVALNQTRLSMVTMQDQLHTANSHLTKTTEDLKKRINGIRLFAQSARKSSEATMQHAKQHMANVSAAGTA